MQMSPIGEHSWFLFELRRNITSHLQAHVIERSEITYIPTSLLLPPYSV